MNNLWRRTPPILQVKLVERRAPTFFLQHGQKSPFSHLDGQASVWRFALTHGPRCTQSEAWAEIVKNTETDACGDFKHWYNPSSPCNFKVFLGDGHTDAECYGRVHNNFTWCGWNSISISLRSGLFAFSVRLVNQLRKTSKCQELGSNLVWIWKKQCTSLDTLLLFHKDVFEANVYLGNQLRSTSKFQEPGFNPVWKKDLTQQNSLE